LLLGVASPGAPNEKDGVVGGAVALEPKSNDLLAVGVVWLAKGLLTPVAEKVNPLVWIGVAAGVVEVARGAPKVNGVADGADEVDVPNENGAGEGVTAGVVDFPFPNENPVVWVGVATGVVELPPGPEPKENALSFVGVLSSNAGPRESGLVGLGDSDPNENGLDCGVVLTFKVGVGLGKEKAGFTGDGVEGVVEAGRDVEETGVDLAMGWPNENGAGAGFVSGATAVVVGAEGAMLPNEKGLGASFIPSLGGETDKVGMVDSGEAPNENGLAAGAFTFAGWAEIGGKVKPDPVVAGFVVPGAGRKLNAEGAGVGVAWAEGAGVDGASAGAELNENSTGRLGCAIGAMLGIAAGAGVEDPKPNDTGGVACVPFVVAAGSALAKGFEGNTGAWGGCSVIGVMLNAPRTVDSVGVVDIISLPVESLLV
jgi:hypothetical protein